MIPSTGFEFTTCFSLILPLLIVQLLKNIEVTITISHVRFEKYFQVISSVCATSFFSLCFIYIKKRLQQNLEWNYSRKTYTSYNKPYILANGTGSRFQTKEFYSWWNISGPTFHTPKACDMWCFVLSWNSRQLSQDMFLKYIDVKYSDALKIIKNSFYFNLIACCLPMWRC